MSRTKTDWKRLVRREIQASRKIVVLGVGNKARGDDAAGLICAESIKKATRGKARSRLRILQGREVPENWTGIIRKIGPDLVLILDAGAGPYRPGTIFLVEKDALADEGVSTHKISLALFVRYLEETVGCKTIILGIQPGKNDFGSSLSLPVKKAVQKLSEYFASLMA
jgi:hydrogenase 3 maturation protease